jgi:S1-C subfamily serine protease
VSPRLSAAAAIGLGVASLALGAAQKPRSARPGPAAERSSAAHERTYETLKPSLYTIGSTRKRQRQSTLRAYLVSRDSHLVTNHHVVGSYVDDPDRRLRAKGAAGPSKRSQADR